MSGCDVHLENLEDFAGLGYWIATTLGIFTLFTWLTWDSNKYAFFVSQANFIPEIVLHGAVYIWMLMSGWSAWRVWYCDNWDVEPAPLAIYMVKIIFIALITPSFMKARRLWVPTSTTLIAIVFAIINLILFAIEDEWAAVLGVVDLLSLCTILVVFLYLIYINPIINEGWLKLGLGQKNNFVRSGRGFVYNPVDVEPDNRAETDLVEEMDDDPPSIPEVLENTARETVKFASVFDPTNAVAPTLLDNGNGSQDAGDLATIQGQNSSKLIASALRARSVRK